MLYFTGGLLINYLKRKEGKEPIKSLDWGMSHGETGHGTQCLEYLGLPGISELLGTAMDVHGPELCRPPRMKQNDAVVAELLSILWQREAEMDRGSCKTNTSCCASFPK